MMKDAGYTTKFYNVHDCIFIMRNHYENTLYIKFERGRKNKKKLREEKNGNSPVIPVHQLHLQMMKH